MKSRSRRAEATGKLKIGDTWNAITIIALSQNSPLKAIAEFVENSIDAKARRITIVRGKEKGKTFLRVRDDGEGIPRDANGAPDFQFVATHVCDSAKRKMKESGVAGIQGEFGIGLLSFWTVGEELTLSSAGADGCIYQMHLVRNEPGYDVRKRHSLVAEQGTELTVSPLLPGLRQLSGEKIQWYLASELRDRIRTSGVNIRVIDRQARKEFKVEPRQFTGRLLHQLPSCGTAFGDAYLELYLGDPAPERQVGLYRAGTRVLDSMAKLDRFQREPWTGGYIEGIVDAPFLRLTPGTRDGIIQDETSAGLYTAMESVEAELTRLINEQREAEEQRASKDILKSVQKALREALLALPADEYDWFDVKPDFRGSGAVRGAKAGDGTETSAEGIDSGDKTGKDSAVQKQFFEHEGPLFSVKISPASVVVAVNTKRAFRALARDRANRPVEKGLNFEWRVQEGGGTLSATDGECAEFIAPAEPGLTTVDVKVRQGAVECSGTALVTVAAELLPESREGTQSRKGLPGYTFHTASGELWRSKYDAERNLVVINNGHRDFVFAARNRNRKLRYICRLFTKELVLHNFAGIPPDQMIERMIELSLYTEENLR